MPEKLSVEVSVENAEAMAKLAETDAAEEKVVNTKRGNASTKALQQHDKELKNIAESAKKADAAQTKMSKNEEKAATTRLARNKKVLSPHQEFDAAIREVSRRKSSFGELTPGGGAGGGGVGGGGGAIPLLPMPTAIPDITGEAKKATRRIKEASEAAQKGYAPLPQRGPGGRMMSMRPEAIAAREEAAAAREAETLATHRRQILRMTRQAYGGNITADQALEQFAQQHGVPKAEAQRLFLATKKGPKLLSFMQQRIAEMQAAPAIAAREAVKENIKPGEVWVNSARQFKLTEPKTSGNAAEMMTSRGTAGLKKGEFWGPSPAGGAGGAKVLYHWENGEAKLGGIPVVKPKTMLPDFGPLVHKDQTLKGILPRWGTPEAFGGQQAIDDLMSRPKRMAEMSRARSPLAAGDISWAKSMATLGKPLSTSEMKKFGSEIEGVGKKTKLTASEFDKWFKKLGDKTWKKLISSIGGFLKDLFALGPQMMKFTLSFAKIGAMASLAGGAVGTFIAAIGPSASGLAGLFVGALSAIPGVLAGVGASAGAGFLGMYKLKGAFSALGEQMALGPLSGIGERRQAYTDMVNAMSKLTPSGRAFFDYIKGLVPLYKSLAAHTQGILLPKIETGLKIAMPSLQANFIPLIERAAAGIGNLFIKWAKFSASLKGSTEMKAIFKSGGDFMSTMGDNLLGLIKDFAALGSSVGVKALHSLGATLHNANAEFAHFISSGNAMKLFDDWTKDFDKFHASLKRAWPTLHSLGQEFMQAYKTLSPLLGIGGHIAAGLIKNLSGPINQLLKGLGTAVKPLGQALTMAFSGLFKGLGSKGMNTMFKDLGSAFLLIGKLLKQVLPVLGPALINVLSMVLKGITPLVPMFGKVFVTAISDLLKVLVKTWPAFQNVLNAVLPLLPNLMNLTMKAIIPMIDPLDKLVLALLQLANQVLIPLIPSMSTFLQLAMALVTPLVGVVTQLAKIPGFAPALLAIFAAWKVDKFLQGGSALTSGLGGLTNLVGLRNTGVLAEGGMGIGGTVISGAAALAIGYAIGSALNSKFHWSTSLANWITGGRSALTTAMVDAVKQGYKTITVENMAVAAMNVTERHGKIKPHETVSSLTGTLKTLDFNQKTLAKNLATAKKGYAQEYNLAAKALKQQHLDAATRLYHVTGKAQIAAPVTKAEILSYIHGAQSGTFSPWSVFDVSVAQKALNANAAQITKYNKAITKAIIAANPYGGSSLGSTNPNVNLFIDSPAPKPKPTKKISPSEAVSMIHLVTGGSWGRL
jgi:hypothetical protein